MPDGRCGARSQARARDISIPPQSGRARLVGYVRASARYPAETVQLDALKAGGCEVLLVEAPFNLDDDPAPQPVLQAALGEMREGDTLVVCRLDGLAQSVEQLVDVVATLGRRKVGLRVLTHPIDMGTLETDPVSQIMIALAEFERGLALERACLEVARARRRVRRSRRRRAPMMDEAAIAEARLLLRDSTLTVVEVARRMGVSHTTLYMYIPGGRSTVHPAGGVRSEGDEDAPD